MKTARDRRQGVVKRTWSICPHLLVAVGHRRVTSGVMNDDRCDLTH